MKYTTKTAEYTWTGYKTNIEIAKERNKSQCWKKYRNTEEIGCNM
jgi:hypothetical protein